MTAATQRRTLELLPSTVGRLPGACCGMVVNVDPDFHAARYAHTPAVIVDGVRYEWDGVRFAEVVSS